MGEPVEISYEMKKELACIRDRVDRSDINTVYQRDVRLLLTLVNLLFRREAQLMEDIRLMKAIDANSRKSSH
jgi:hypothetical protein